MSLDPRDSRIRGRSKSPGRRDSSRTRGVTEERERSRVRVPSPPSVSSSRYEEPRSRGYNYEERDTTTVRSSAGGSERDRDGRDRQADIVTAEPRDGGGYGGFSHYQDKSPVPGARDRDKRDSYDMPVPGAFQVTQSDERDVRYESDRRERDYYTETRYTKKDEYGRPVSPPEQSRYESDKRYKVDNYKHEKERDNPRDREPVQYEDGRYGRERGGAFNISAGHSSISGAINIGRDKHGRSEYAQPDPGLAYGSPPDKQTSYADPKKWQYAQAPPEGQITYSQRQETTYNTRPVSPPQKYPGRDSREKHDRHESTSHGRNESTSHDRHGSTSHGRHESASHDRHGSASYGTESARSSRSQIVTVEPGSRRHRDSSPNPAMLGAMGGLAAGAGVAGLAPRMHNLSISTGHHGGASMSLANAPGSPLLESYHGTYQSISPMPSPLLMASTSHADINYVEPLSPYSSDEDRKEGKKSKRTARFHDPEEEARILAKALEGKRAPDIEPIVEILPGLTHEQTLELRDEYKRIVKTGTDKKGVNIAKHIKLRLKEEDPSLMKACYVCALGKWESEAYWANFWYQGERNRRELLIESLMGRTNREIREIKDGFSDKKYSNDLIKCMKTELKEDKFKKAILLVLDEKKMEDRHGLDQTLIEDDVYDLHKAVSSSKGGESAMISIIVVRSDAHLREMLKSYERQYGVNFAREMLKKSGNLVGELLAHILNGVINKPVRDALLVHHALALSKSDSIRSELLISRLVRYHWDRPHMEAVKREYRNKYKVDMQKAVAEGTRGEWGRFCEMLCVRRMGDEVREVTRVEEYSRERDHGGDRERERRR